MDTPTRSHGRDESTPTSLPSINSETQSTAQGEKMFYSLMTVVYTRGVSVTFDQSYMDGCSVWGTLTLIDNSQT